MNSTLVQNLKQLIYYSFWMDRSRSTSWTNSISWLVITDRLYYLLLKNMIRDLWWAIMFADFTFAHTIFRIFPFFTFYTNSIKTYSLTVSMLFVCVHIIEKNKKRFVQWTLQYTKYNTKHSVITLYIITYSLIWSIIRFATVLPDIC